jgi:hypothetical protein
MSGFTLSPTAFTATRNGRAFYCYSGGQTGGAGDITLIDIANSSLDDLLAKIYFAVDWPQVVQTLGFSVAIDGVAVFNNVANVAAATSYGGFAPYELIIPAQSAFSVASGHDGASGGASRSAYVVAYPLLVMGA